jgi:hypothetical protein
MARKHSRTASHRIEEAQMTTKAGDTLLLVLAVADLACG